MGGSQQGRASGTTTPRVERGGDLRDPQGSGARHHLHLVSGGLRSGALRSTRPRVRSRMGPETEPPLSGSKHPSSRRRGMSGHTCFETRTPLGPTARFSYSSPGGEGRKAHAFAAL